MLSNWRSDLLNADRISFDIELRDTETLLCCGFAASESKAYVFTENRRSEIEEILRSPVPKVGHNLQFDCYWLLSRWGLKVEAVTDDTMIMWHSLYPELAGSSDQKSYRMTRKGLSFLASIRTSEPYWKFYDTDDAGMYELNGRDCCVTWELAEKLDSEIDELGVREIYEHSMSLVWPCVEMQRRGLVVDEAERQRRVSKLSERHSTLVREINELAQPILKDRKDRVEDSWHLFEVGGFETESGRRETCPCCNGGSKKSEHCVDCAGIEGSGANGGVLKDDLLRWAGQEFGLDSWGYESMTKDELFELVPECQVCGGDGKRTEFKFNPQSDDQKKALLYDALKCPKRYNSGSLSVDESSLKSILGALS